MVVSVTPSTEVYKNAQKVTLAGVTQWIECQPANQRVTSSIPTQGTYLGCRTDGQQGHMRGNHTLMFLSLSFFLPSPLSKNKQIKSFKNAHKFFVVFLHKRPSIFSNSNV